MRESRTKNQELRHLVSFIAFLCLFSLVAGTSWAARFVDNGDGTVTDTQIGLMWQQADDGTQRKLFEDLEDPGLSAGGYCQDLLLGGYTDWRLPGIDELETIINYAVYNPASFFPFVTRSDIYWSETFNPTRYAWGVSFSDGSTWDYPLFFPFYVRCVRGGPFWPFDPSTEFQTPSGKPDTVLDTYWGYMWQKGDSGDTPLNWDQAAAYCDGLELDGYTDWRVPEIEALLTFVPYTRFNPALCFGSSRLMDFIGYWSSTTYAGNPDYAWGSFCDRGGAGRDGKTDDFYVRCVRGGPGSFGTLMLSKSGSGTGKVTSDPAGIDCGTGCTEQSKDFQVRVITLEAEADADSFFIGWSGGGCSGTGSCVVTVPYPGPTVVIAQFMKRSRHVDDNILTSGDGKSWATAFKTLQEAVDASSKGDEIWVRGSDYALTAPVVVNKAVSIYGGFSGYEILRDERNWRIFTTTLNGQGNSQCLQVSDNATIDGFVITKCQATLGGGVFSTGAKPKFSNCKFVGNTADSGGAVYALDSTIDFSNCMFSGNSAIQGGAVYNQNSVTTIGNCTFSSNSASSGGGGIYNNSGGAVTIVNSILWGDKQGSTPNEIEDSVGAVTVTYSDIDGGHIGAGNISSDPLFVDPTSGILALRQASPCIDHGTSSGTVLVSEDLDGNPRVLDGDGDGVPVVDMGAYEYLPPFLAVDFGSVGLWLYGNGAWSQLSSFSPNHMASYGNELVANFSGYGLWQYDGTSWTQLTSNSSVEDLVGGTDKLYADYGGLGLWKYDGAWTQLNPANPNRMAANGNNLLANFPSFGLYQYDGAIWTQLTSTRSMDDMLDTSGKIYVDFGSLGLWKYDGGWTQLTSANPDKMQAYDGKLAANFPSYGLYQYDGTTWTQLTSNDSVEDIVGVSGNLYADYGPLGLWKYDGTWTQLAAADPNRLGSYGDKLVANFPGYGLYEYDGSSWTLLTGNGGATDMVAVDLP